MSTKIFNGYKLILKKDISLNELLLNLFLSDENKKELFQAIIYDEIYQKIKLKKENAKRLADLLKNISKKKNILSFHPFVNKNLPLSYSSTFLTEENEVESIILDKLNNELKEDKNCEHLSLSYLDLNLISERKLKEFVKSRNVCKENQEFLHFNLHLFPKSLKDGKEYLLIIEHHPFLIGNKDDMLLILNYFFSDLFEVVPYFYFNNTDKPDELSDFEWKNREIEWNEVVQNPYYSIGEQTIKIEFIKPVLYHDLKNFIEVYFQFLNKNQNSLKMFNDFKLLKDSQVEKIEKINVLNEEASFIKYLEFEDIKTRYIFNKIKEENLHNLFLEKVELKLLNMQNSYFDSEIQDLNLNEIFKHFYSKKTAETLLKLFHEFENISYEDYFKMNDLNIFQKNLLLTLIYSYGKNWSINDILSNKKEFGNYIKENHEEFISFLS